MENTFVERKPDSSLSSEQCIITKKVCDLCTQRDCLSPLALTDSKLIDPGRSCEEFPVRIDGSDALIFQPGDIIQLPADINIVKQTGKFTICDCNTDSIEPLGGCGITKKGYWKITLSFQFCYSVQFFRGITPVTIEIDRGQGFVPLDSLAICNSFTKTIVLFGGNTCKCNDNTVDITFCDTAFEPNGPFSNEVPFVFTQSEACLLDLKLAPNVALLNQIAPTIGLFVVVKTYRISNLLVNSLGDCLVEEDPCTDISTDPCELFSNLDFPFKDFDPCCNIPK